MPTLNPNNYAYLWSPTRQMLDKNGKPMIGGYVMLDKHGTPGIPAESYCDWNGTLNARKILLDGLGRASAIVENDKLYDMYVYNKFNVLEYSALGVNCTGEGGSDSPMRFTSNDGSIEIYRSGNEVDFSVHKDPSIYGSATGDSVDSSGALLFDNVTGDITIVSSNKLSLDIGKLYHVTVQAEISIPTAMDSYYDCTMRDSENVEHKFSIDGSRSTQLIDLSWDLPATHDYFRMYFSLPSGANINDVVVYIHSINSISADGTLFLAEYGVTSFRDILIAYKQNKIVYCRFDSPFIGRCLAFLAWTNESSTFDPTTFQFHYYRSQAPDRTDKDELYILNCFSGNPRWSQSVRQIRGSDNGDGLSWDRETNKLSVKPKENGGIVVDSTGVSLTDPIPPHTAADAGKILGVDSNGNLAWVTP